MPTGIQKVLDLQKQYEEAKQTAIQELLDQRKTIDEQLKALGYVQGAPATKQRQSDPNKVCPVCSEKGHDARRHKNDPKPPATKPPEKPGDKPATPKPESKR